MASISWPLGFVGLGVYCVGLTGFSGPRHRGACFFARCGYLDSTLPGATRKSTNVIENPKVKVVLTKTVMSILALERGVARLQGTQQNATDFTSNDMLDDKGSAGDMLEHHRTALQLRVNGMHRARSQYSATTLQEMIR